MKKIIVFFLAVVATLHPLAAANKEAPHTLLSTLATLQSEEFEKAFALKPLGNDRIGVYYKDTILSPQRTDLRLMQLIGLGWAINGIYPYVSVIGNLSRNISESDKIHELIMKFYDVQAIKTELRHKRDLYVKQLQDKRSSLWKENLTREKYLLVAGGLLLTIGMTLLIAAEMGSYNIASYSSQPLIIISSQGLEFLPAFEFQAKKAGITTWANCREISISSLVASAPDLNAIHHEPFKSFLTISGAQETPTLLNVFGGIEKQVGLSLVEFLRAAHHHFNPSAPQEAVKKTTLTFDEGFDEKAASFNTTVKNIIVDRNGINLLYKRISWLAIKNAKEEALNHVNLDTTYGNLIVFMGTKDAVTRFLALCNAVHKVMS